MASGYILNGTDLDDLFEPYTSGTKGEATGYQVGGVDLNQRYQPIASGLQGPLTGKFFASAGGYSNTDLANIFGANASNYTIATKNTSVKTVAWTGEVIHEVRLTFSSPASIATFFEYSGQIRFSASRTGGSNHAQNTSMTEFLSGVGTVLFGEKSTTSTGDGMGYPIGYLGLNTTYQLVFAANNTGLYGGDGYRIEARLESSTILSFKVIFKETDDLYPRYNEPVDGTLTSTVAERRHNTQSSPTYLTISEL